MVYEVVPSTVPLLYNCKNIGSKSTAVFFVVVYPTVKGRDANGIKT